jgi:aminoglycoside phosphotransferase (APT) family kinase protein
MRRFLSLPFALLAITAARAIAAGSALADMRSLEETRLNHPHRIKEEQRKRRKEWKGNLNSASKKGMKSPSARRK